MRQSYRTADSVDFDLATIQDMRKWWKRELKEVEKIAAVGSGSDPGPFAYALKELQAAVRALAEDLLLARGFWKKELYADQPAKKSTKLHVCNPDRIKHEVQQRLRELANNLSAGIDFIGWLERNGTPSETDPEYDHSREEQPYHVVFKYIRRRCQETVADHVKRADTAVSAGLFNVLTRYVNTCGFGLTGQPDSPKAVSLISYPRERSVGRVKIIMQDIPDVLVEDPGSRDTYKVELLARSSVEAQDALERKGLGFLWYGQVFINHPAEAIKIKEGPEAGKDAGGAYWSSTDVIRVYMDKTTDPFIYLLLHELGHRYWFKFMPQEQRLGFAEWFGKVQPVSTYGTTNASEEFAETFASYVLNRDLTRDQVDRFKAFLGKGRVASLEDEGFVGKRWGSQGAGLLLTTGTEVLLVKRSPYVEEPNTWGYPGGAVRRDRATGEYADIKQSAIREAREELGSLPPYRLRAETFVYRKPSFVYTTFIGVVSPADAARCAVPTSFDWESTAAGWFTPEDLGGLDLHFGFANLLDQRPDLVFFTQRRS